MKQHTGIVLKSSHSTLQDIVILDQYLGKISGNIARHTPIAVGNGTLLAYTLVQKKQHFIFEHVELEYVPFACARDDIFFLHHILELCYYFLPEACAVDELFPMLVYLMQVVPYEKVYTRKYLIVARLLVLFGFYPEQEHVCAYVQEIADLPLDAFFESTYQGRMQDLVQQWIWSCIMTHPHKRRFKTIGLLKKAEIHES